MPAEAEAEAEAKAEADAGEARPDEIYSLVVLGRRGFRVDMRGWRCSRRSFSRGRRRRRRLRGQRRTSAVGARARAGADAEGSLMVGHCRPAESSRRLPCDADKVLGEVAGEVVEAQSRHA